MASTALADIVNTIPTEFTQFVLSQTEIKNKFVQSGIVRRSPILDQFLQIDTGSNTLNRPAWNSLSRSVVERVATDTSGSIVTGSSGLTGVNNITSYNEVAVKMIRTVQWGARKLVHYIAGDDPMSKIVGDISDFEAYRLQVLVLAVLAGVFADNDAAPSGSDTHTEDDLTVDVSGVTFVDGTTNFSADNLFNAQQTMGDSQDDLKILAVHSAVFTRMKKNNLIDFKQDSVTGASLATFQGLDVVYDDGMPKSGQVYDSYLFAPGALELGWGNPEKASEVVWVPDAGDGIGEEVLFRRWITSVHPIGHAFLGTSTGGGPDNTNLALAASWSRRCPERKQVKIARLKTREA